MQAQNTSFLTLSVNDRAEITHFILSSVFLMNKLYASAGQKEQFKLQTATTILNI